MLLEINLDTLDIPMEIVLGIRMASADHLREINHGHSLLVIDHQVELVEITVN